MKLIGALAVHVKGEAILRQPGIWDKLRRAFGGEPDLRTGRVKAALAASAVVDSVRDALRRLGANNAVSLVVDDLVLFQDKEGKPDDLGDLFLAFHEQSDAIGDGFDLLRLAVEHVEAGLHLVIEVQAKGIHPEGEPPVRVVISGRLQDLEPRPGEAAEAYRSRIEPITRDKSALEVARMQFESFVSRVKDAVAMAMPEARVDIVTAEARVQRPGDAPARQAAAEPAGRQYDPFDYYYPSPLYSVMNIMMWSSIFHMGMSPGVVVINQGGDPVGTVDTPGIATADPSPAEFTGDSDGDFDNGGDFDGGGDDFGGGGDFDSGGDFGGFD